MDWEHVITVMDDWVEKLAAPAYDLRQSVASTLTSYPVGYYWNPQYDCVGIYADGATAIDQAHAKMAACRAVGHGNVAPFLSYQDLADPDSFWIKVAYSPTLRAIGENLNFFPGQYVNGLPNSPSPLAAMLTTGLLGAGLGWGTGKVMQKVMPNKFGDKLSRTGLLVGGALGALPGAMWAGTNRLVDKHWNDPSLTQGDPLAPDLMNHYQDGTNDTTPSQGTDTSEALEDIRTRLEQTPLHRLKRGAAESPMFHAACVKAAETFGFAEQHAPASPVTVNIDALGRTLWDHGATPTLATAAMASLYAAKQLPDPHSRPGVVTGHQLGLLAQNAAGDYTKGYLVGAALNAVVGTPYRAPAYGLGSAALGVIGSVLPKLFGG